ncbi:LysR family transcriptional regulator [Noviherbaspirillum denitrificans]|uniref:LysR family transcriptional regulator n=1 Tax=Noviherbaspirillum denitrificans TaxID=1968433 RepID=A0A254TCR3_9BURK|nr:LysR family transcriptional regulator [Noviherbaspirillum denitrificans]OWW20421.1 LysR family transcriptional regulator [Noviherbaspirillum denitrificans]
MKIDTLGVQAFVAIADHGSFQAAADSLFLSQTGVTRRLQTLEEFLGVKLIERTTRTVALTSTGQDFLPQARRLLGELSSSLIEIRETGKSRRGNVTIACVPTVGVRFLPRIIQEYSSAFPDNRIKILDHSSSGVGNAVLQREAEFGINIAGPHHAELESVPLLEDHFAFVCREDHQLAKRKEIDWKQLEKYPLILLGQFSGNRALLEQAFGSHSLKLQSLYEVQRVSTALGLVAEGVGVAVLPQLSMQKDAYPRIRVIPLANPRISRTLVLLSRKTAIFSPAAEALYELIRKAGEVKPR